MGSRVEMPASLNENLRALALEAYQLSDRLCGDCRNFHALWPYLRLAKASGGDIGEPLIGSILRQLLLKGDRILVAGCADTGLLAVVARAAAPGTKISLLDQCLTPLELCRRFARRWSLPTETIHCDLINFSVHSSYDIVFAHALLQFIPSEFRVDVLSRIRLSLRPDGRLLIAFRTSSKVEGVLLHEYRENYRQNVVEQLECRNVELPEPREEFYRRLEEYSEERRKREGVHQSYEEVEALLKAASLEIEKVYRIESDQSDPFRRFAAKIHKKRYLTIARRK
jgi:SAM-dependent methyltransferase